MDSENPNLITVVVANGDPDERELCSKLLDKASGVKVVAVVPRWEEVLAKIQKHRPQVLLLQWNLGFWASAAEDWLTIFRIACPSMRILVLARPTEKSAAQWAMVHGVRGVLTIEACPRELLQAVCKVAEKNEAWISRKELKDVLGRRPDSSQ